MPGALSWDSPSEMAQSRVLAPCADSHCTQGHRATRTSPCEKPHPCISQVCTGGRQVCCPLGRDIAFGCLSVSVSVCPLSWSLTWVRERSSGMFHLVFCTGQEPVWALPGHFSEPFCVAGTEQGWGGLIFQGPPAQSVPRSLGFVIHRVRACPRPCTVAWRWPAGLRAGSALGLRWALAA